MSIENGVFNSCTPAECYVYKQVASWVIIVKQLIEHSQTV